MSDRKFATDMGSWKRLGRRWIAIVSAMLCGNLCLIVLAVAGFGGSTPNSGERNGGVAVGELREEAAVVSDTVVSNEVKPEAALTEQEKTAEVAEITVTVVPATAQVEPAKTELIVQTEPQPTHASEPEQQVATEAAKVVQDGVVPQVKEEARSVPMAKGEMVIVNPPTTGGTVHFVVEGEIYSLPAGTCRRFAGKNPQRVVFHKGDDESDAEHELESGLFAFAVGSAGWELVPVDLEDSAKVLRGCRLAAE